MKKIKINIDKEKIDIVDITLIIFLIISLLIIFNFKIENQKLLEQVDESIAMYNEVNYEYNLLNNAYEELKKDYEYVVDFIRSNDRYVDIKEEK